jgi:hypothetical protein
MMQGYQQIQVPEILTSETISKNLQKIVNEMNYSYIFQLTEY